IHQDDRSISSFANDLFKACRAESGHADDYADDRWRCPAKACLYRVDHVNRYGLAFPFRFDEVRLSSIGGDKISLPRWGNRGISLCSESSYAQEAQQETLEFNSATLWGFSVLQ
ncbi:hypothetical protein, partial [Streptomyces sp. NL15-2K]|uniref:hypothetical protein n=1 Tax=Streptomyces sp. NL15-2K TaxID=376149 RepID=UPI0026E9AAA8